MQEPKIPNITQDSVKIEEFALIITSYISLLAEHYNKILENKKIAELTEDIWKSQDWNRALQEITNEIQGNNIP